MDFFKINEKNVHYQYIIKYFNINTEDSEESEESEESEDSEDSEE